MKTLTNKKGFTLVELLVVITIIGILGAVLVPSLTSYIDKAKKSAALQEAEPLRIAYETYLIDDEDYATFEEYAVALLGIGVDQIDFNDDTNVGTFTAKNGYVINLSVENNKLVLGEPTKQ